ncbi:MAG: NAD(P)/FAD-dependent oxidoreductase [Chloroflexi bacterium]|nr:NAD(P)/FAD-dependent oxidoreductase [Chloroflexota bacterium]MCL5075247.1 NAD(P)/FAD-dependent oxidoreductase [Chloroflexota bacterium]
MNGSTAGYSSFDVIIIGAGLTGLAAAYVLTSRGRRTLVLEKDTDLGGLVQSYDFNGFAIEKYYHHMFVDDQHLLRLFRELGLEREISWKTGSTGYFIVGRTYRLDTPLEILRYDRLSLIDKMRLALAVLQIRRKGLSAELDNTSARRWISQNCGEGVFTNFFRPLLHSKFGPAMDQVSAAWLTARVRIRSSRSVTGEQLGYPQHGFKSLVDALAARIKENGGSILASTAAERIIVDARNTVQGVSTRKGEFYAPKVLSTVDPGTLRTLVNLPGSDLTPLHYQGVSCALFGLKRKITNTYWLNLDAPELPFGLLVEHTNFHDILEYGGAKMLYVVSYHADDGFMQQDEDKVIEQYLSGLRKGFDILPEDVLWWRLSRHKAAGPIYAIGYRSLIPPHELSVKGLFGAGMLYSYPDRSMNDSVRQGLYWGARLASN